MRIHWKLSAFADCASVLLHSSLAEQEFAEATELELFYRRFGSVAPAPSACRPLHEQILLALPKGSKRQINADGAWGSQISLRGSEIIF